MTFPLLVTTPRIIAVDRNLVCMTVGISFGSVYNILSFIQFTVWSWSKFLSSEKNQSILAWKCFHLFNKRFVRIKRLSLVTPNISTYACTGCFRAQRFWWGILKTWGSLIDFPVILSIFFLGMLYKVMCCNAIRKLCMNFALFANAGWLTSGSSSFQATKYGETGRSERLWTVILQFYGNDYNVFHLPNDFRHYLSPK